ncbi:MAG: hypothetical protein FWD57_06165 [Polyangiaceae bacterium]|nr:hypothetical protein [Polyangiaceae bacterium]
MPYHPPAAAGSRHAVLIAAMPQSSSAPTGGAKANLHLSCGPGKVRASSVGLRGWLSNLGQVLRDFEVKPIMNVRFARKRTQSA